MNAAKYDIEVYKIRSFMNFSRKYTVLGLEGQEEWAKLNYKAAQEIAENLKKRGTAYLAYDYYHPYISAIVNDVIAKRKEIDEIFGKENYLVGKPRENNNPYQLNSEEKVLSKWATDIGMSYNTAIARIHFPDEDTGVKAQQIAKEGIVMRNKIANTEYGFKVSPKSEDRNSNLVLYSPDCYDNNGLIESAMGHLFKAMEANKTETVLHSLASFKREFIIATPFNSGTSSFSDIMEKAVLESKGITYFNYKRNSPSRDVIAFLCPDNDVYHKEYMDLYQIPPGQKDIPTFRASNNTGRIDFGDGKRSL